MKKKLITSLLAMTVFISMISTETKAKEPEKENPVMAELYVSPTGNANAQGTREDPLDSMESARMKVETMNQNMTGDIVVYFEDGEYLVKDTVAFTTADSGSNGYRVIYKAEDGAHPVFTGGVHVSGWGDAGDAEHPGMMVADVDIENTRQLYVDGLMATRARGSISGKMERDGEKTVFTTYNGEHDAYTGFTVENTEIQNWKNLGDVEFVWDISWAHRIAKVESIQPEDETHSFIQMRWDTFKTGQIAGGVQIQGPPDYVENAYELLDEPGEWYFDRAAKKLYYMPEAGQDMNAVDVIVPGVEEIITVTGERSQKAGDIGFEGLQFEYNTWLTPSEMGWPEQQANFAHDPKEDFNMHAYSLAPGAAIETKYAQGITFDRCTFQNLGSAAVNLLEGSVDSMISNSVFKSISAGGIMVGGASITDAHPLLPGDTIENHIQNGTAHDAAQFVKNNTIENNYFNEIGTEYKGSIAVVAGYTDHTVIKNNTIRNVAYSGISVGWGWGFWDQNGRYNDGNGDNTPDNETPAAYPRFPKGDAAESRNNVIEANDISQCMMKLHDGAGIYTLGDMPDSEIKGNLVHDNVGWPGGIYLDEGSGGMTVTDNITYHTQIALNDNVRDHTWGYRYDRPVYSDDTNYFNVSPDMEQYPEEIAAKAGVQGENIIPKELNEVIAPEFVESGDKIVLKGHFGEQTGKIVLTGIDGNVEVSQESGKIISWTDTQIVFRMPGGVKSGTIYVETADGIQTNKNHKLTVGGFEEELFYDDFEGYETGRMSGQASAEENYTAVSENAVIEKSEDGSKVLKLVSAGGDTSISKDAQWKDVMVSADFKFDSDPKSWYRTFSVSPRYMDNQNKVESSFTSYSNGILLDQRVNDNLSRSEAKYSYKTGTWYSAKVAMVGNSLKVKVWEKGKQEPSLWTGSANYQEIKQGGLFLSFIDADRNNEDTNAAEIDNLRVVQYGEGVTTDLSYDKIPPTISAELSGSKGDNGNYESEVKLTLNAQDAESEIAQIEYSLNGADFEDYTEPLQFTKNGEYEIVYRASDRAGNMTAEKKIKFTVDLKEASQILFEEDFEDYNEGNFAEQKGEYTLDNGQGVGIVTDVDGNKKIRLKAQGWGNDVNVMKESAWENTDTVMTFDMMYKFSPKDYGGAYVSNYFQSNDNKYSYMFTPNWGGILFQKRTGGSADNFTQLSNDQFRVEADTQYHVKVRTSEGTMALKIWAENEEEPEEWMHQGQLSGLNGAGGLEFSFMDENTENYVEYDNIKVLGFGSQKMDTTRVVFETAPENAVVTVTDTDGNQKEAQEDGSFLLSGGTYQYTVSAQGYQSVNGMLEVNGETGTTVYISLNETETETDRTELDQLIQEGLAIEDLEKYTSESAERFRTALENALRIDENATQEEIDQAAKELKAAIEGLTRKEDDNTSGNNPDENNSNGNDSNINNPNGENAGTNKPNENVPGSGAVNGNSAAGQSSVKTGDTMNWMPILGVAASVLAIAAVLLIRKQKQKKK